MWSQPRLLDELKHAISQKVALAARESDVVVGLRKRTYRQDVRSVSARTQCLLPATVRQFLHRVKSRRISASMFGRTFALRQSAARAAEVRKMKQTKENHAEVNRNLEPIKANDRSIVKSIRNTMIIGLPLTTVLSGVLAVGFAIASL